MLPDFFVIGAGRSGTTSLYALLKEHPEIYMCPIKEPCFFACAGEPLDFRGPGASELYRVAAPGEIARYADEGRPLVVVDDARLYEGLFEGAGDAKALGEASVLYLYSAAAAARINERIPGARLIAILRNPVERAFSQYRSLVMAGREPASDFETALEKEEQRVEEGWAPDWFYTRLGFYHRQLAPWFELFDRRQIKICLHEDLRRDPAALMRDIYGFLGVDSSFVPDVSRRRNRSRYPRSRLLHRFLAFHHPVKTALKALLPCRLERPFRGVLDRIRSLNTKRPELPPELRRRLVEVFREDMEKLQVLIGRDLSSWFEGARVAEHA